MVLRPVSLQVQGSAVLPAASHLLLMAAVRLTLENVRSPDPNRFVELQERAI